MNEFVKSACPAGVDYMVKAMRACNKAAVAESKTVAFKAIGSTPDGIIVGIGAAAGSPDKLDLDGEFFSQGDLTKIAYDFCSAKDRKFLANHKNALDCDLVCSWPGSPIIKDGRILRTLDAGESVTDSMDIIGINIEKGRETHWVVGVKPRDQAVCALAANGGIAGFSVGVLANRCEA